MASHRLHVPPSATVAAPYNDQDRPWALVNDSDDPFEPVVPISTTEPVWVVGDVTDYTLIREEEQTAIIPAGCTLGWLQFWSGRQTSTLTLDLSALPTSSLSGEPIAGIVIFNFIADFLMQAFGNEVFTPIIVQTYRVDGDVWAIVSDDHPPPERFPMPVPPFLLGAPPLGTDWIVGSTPGIRFPTQADWFIWWGPDLGDDIPAVLTIEVEVQFDAKRSWRRNDPGGLCQASADAAAAAFGDDQLNPGIQPQAPDLHSPPRVYGVKFVGPDIPPDLEEPPGSIDLTPGPEGHVDVSQPVAGDIGSHLGGHRLPKAALEQLARRHGAPDPNLAAAVALSESSGYTGATNSYVEDGVTHIVYGLWQISDIHAGEGFNVGRAFDPDYNAEWMMRLSDNGTDWSAWEGYTNGSYVQYL